MEASEGISPKPLAIFHWQHCILNNITKKKNAYKKKISGRQGGNLSVLLLRVRKKKAHSQTLCLSVVNVN